MRTALTLAALLFAAPLAPAQPVARPADASPTELTDYVGAADDSFSWKLIDKTDVDLGTVYTLDMVSQTWQRLKWEHKLQLFVPKGVKPQSTVVLWNEGGEPGLRSQILGFEVAGRMKAPFAILYGIPRQPLYGGKSEDSLIAESFVRFLVTEDATWPLLFPMVKSVVRSMDAIQAFAKTEWNFEVKSFVIAGASKRGWTAWLTAATGDKRVKAIAPAVFDTLNIPVQMDNQVKAFGRHSEMIKDYADRQLLPLPKTAAASRLWRMVDPWSYRDRLTMPKLIVLGTNDEYWPLDAMNTYWDGLKGDKWVLYVPNAGHRLTPAGQPLPQQALTTLAAFGRCQVFDKPMPKLDAELLCPPGGDCMNVGVRCDVTPSKCQLFTSSATSRDFRKSKWEPQSLEVNGKQIGCKVDLPKSGHRAALVELTFKSEDGAGQFTLSTPLRILETPKK